MILWDSSAVYALADKTDINNKRAKEFLPEILQSQEELVFHNYVVVESVALLQRRLGLKATREFLAQTAKFRIFWIDAQVHKFAEDYFRAHATRKLSFVDCVSFVVRRQQGITRAFAFDEDFQKAGFDLYRREKHI